jgi:hypothetical protein
MINHNVGTGVVLSGSGLDGAGDDAPNAYEAATDTEKGSYIRAARPRIWG